MAVTIQCTVTVPLTVVDATGGAQALSTSVSTGRTAGEVQLTLTNDELTLIQQNGGVVYLFGSDLLQAAQLLAQAGQIGQIAGGGHA